VLGAKLENLVFRHILDSQLRVLQGKQKEAAQQRKITDAIFDNNDIEVKLKGRAREPLQALVQRGEGEGLAGAEARSTAASILQVVHKARWSKVKDSAAVR
jgi:hypothetical protein